MQQAKFDASYKKTAKRSGILWLLLFLASCSGGSTGAPPTLNYTGVTMPVVIDADNAGTLLAGAYEGGLLASVFNISGAVQAESGLAGGWHFPRRRQ